MDAVRRAVALMLAVLWLPASSHVALQHLGLIHEVHEDRHSHDPHASDCGSPESGPHEHGVGNHGAADGECLLASRGPDVDPPRVGSAGPFGLTFDLHGIGARDMAPCDASGLAPPCCTAPPELSRSWQFYLRAALPVRAPSRVS